MAGIKTLKDMSRRERIKYYKAYEKYSKRGFRKWEAIKMARRDVTYGW